MASGLTREQAYEEVKAAGFPVFGAWEHMSPAMVSLFIKKEVAMRSPLDFVTPTELQVIYTVVSAANNCELCLSFHSMALMKQESLSKDDLAVLVAGGLPTGEKLKDGGRLRSMAIAAKYCIAHKGVLLPRERKHLAKLGFTDPKELTEIIFCCGHIHANNMVMVSLIEQGMPVEKMFRQIGPFVETSNNGEESGWWGEDA